MKVDDKTQNSTNQSAESVFDELMRGEHVLLFPPGTFVASLFIPCLAVGVYPLGVLLEALILPNKSYESFSLEFVVSLILIALAIIGFLLIVQGYSIFLVSLKWYIRALIFLVLVASAMVFFGRIDVPLFSCIWAGLTLLGCHFIINSASMNFVAAFFAHKRKYLLERKRETNKILGKKGP